MIIMPPTNIWFLPNGTTTCCRRNIWLLCHHAPILQPVSSAHHAYRNQYENAATPCNGLWKQWANVHRLIQDGVPIIGFTWYSLTHQVDWDTALREDNGHVNELGLYDLDRQIMPVGRAYQKLIQQWRDVLSAESYGLYFRH